MALPRSPLPISIVLALFVAAPARAQEGECDTRREEADRLLDAGEAMRAERIYRELVQARCGRLDGVLYNLAIAYERARLIGRAIRTRLVLIQRFPSSPLAGRALFFMAGNEHALALYGEAAEHYALFAERYPDELGQSCTERSRAEMTCVDARIAMENAVFFRLSLGDREGAAASADGFFHHHGDRFADEAAAIAYALGGPLEDPEEVATYYEQYLETHGAVARLEQRAGALVEIARARTDQGRTADARAALEQVVAIVTPEALASLRGSEMEVALWRARARDALAEALFRLADQRPITIAPPPAFRGRRTAAAIDAWAAGPLSAWRDRQLGAIAGAMEAYRASTEPEVPQWTIAAQERVGDLHARILEAAQGIAVPSWAAEDDALLTAFEDARERTLAIVTAHAIETYELCSIFATRVRWPSERSERCQAALVELDPEHHRPSDELHGDATWLEEAPIRPEPPRPAGGDDAVE